MNNIYYFEIQATEPARALKFYTTVFGWDFTPIPGMSVQYWSLSGAGIPGGLLKRSAEPAPVGAGTNAFTCSVQVADFDTTTKTILAHGGKIALAKFAVP